MCVVVVLDGLGEAMTRLLTWLKRLLIAAAVVLIGFVALAPNKDTYTSNADAPMVTRTLVPRETTTTRATPTTVARTSSAVSIEKVLDEIVVIDGDRVYRLPRSASVMLALYLATAGTR